MAAERRRRPLPAMRCAFLGTLLFGSCAWALTVFAQTVADAAAPPQPASSAAAPAPAEADDESFKWDFSWQDWEGLSFYASQPTKIKGKLEAVSILNLHEVKLAGTIGGRLEVDGAAYGTNGSLSGFDDGFELRRARITAKGASILGVPFSYRVDLGYVPGGFTVTQAYIVVPGVRYLGNLQIGQFTPPVGMQMITSSWDIGFMEPASALQAIAPSSQPGVQAANTYDDRRGTWTLGAYAGLGSGPGSEYGSDSQSFGNLMGRVTWLAVDMTDDKKPTANRYLHLGVSTNLQRAANGQIRYRSRPESYLAPYIIDTGNIDASSARTIGLEALWVGGPLSAQAELIASRVGSDLNGSLNFAGLYAQASWYLTGESRPYNRSDGTPGRLIPLRNFGFGSDKSWGALEVAARVSYTDLSSGTVQGGRLTMLVGSLNWYLRPQLKCMFELGTGRVDDAVGTGNGNGNFVMGQLRLGAYFY